MCIGGLVGSIVTIKMAKPVQVKEKLFLAATGEKITMEEMSIKYNDLLNQYDIVSEEYFKCIKELYLINNCMNCKYCNEDNTYCTKLNIDLKLKSDMDFCMEWRFNPESLPEIDDNNMLEEFSAMLDANIQEEQ